MLRNLMGSSDFRDDSETANFGPLELSRVIGESLGMIQKAECAISRLRQWSVDFLVITLTLIGHYMYHQFNIQQFYVLPTQLYLSVLCGSQNKQRLFPFTALTDRFL
jgi:hypothetical protein